MMGKLLKQTPGTDWIATLRLCHPQPNFPSNFTVGLYIVIERRSIDKNNISALLVSRIAAFYTFDLAGACRETMANCGLAASGRDIDKLGKLEPNSYDVEPAY